MISKNLVIRRIPGYILDENGFFVRETVTYATDILPDSVTRIAPPNLEDGQRARFNGEVWEVLENSNEERQIPETELE